MMESMRNLHIVLFIGVMCVVQAMALVCPYSDSRCTCTSYGQTCYNLQQIPPVNTGVSLSQSWDLSFQDGNITSISNNSLPVGITSLFLYRQPLTNISDDAFDTSATTLQNLNIIGAQFNNLPIALKKLSRLTSLHLEDTPIHVWDAATLKQIAATVNYLELRNVSLYAWPSWISDVDVLFKVDLSRNYLKSIPDDAFSSIKDTLTYLDLSATGLTQGPQGLSTLTVLYHLDLSKNSFTDMSEFDKITGSPLAQKLSYLYLDSVGMRTMANFSNLTNLRAISLSRNSISDVPAGSLPHSLTYLFLSNNRLSSVPKDIAGMSMLSYLDLSSNLIADIESNSFPSRLRTLYLNSNNLTVITNTTLDNLKLLDLLYLDFNPISTISPEAFSDLVSLVSLSILNSHLTEIPLAFTPLNSQIDISLSTTESLTCLCPASPDLVQWFTSREFLTFLRVTCSNGQTIDSYLSGQCGQTSPTP